MDYGYGAITTYSSANSRLVEFVFIGVIFGLVSIPSVGVWAYMGEKLKMIVNHPRKVQLFNTVMALLLVASVIVPIKDSVNFLSLKDIKCCHSITHTFLRIT